MERSQCWERSPTSRPLSMTSLCWQPILTNCPLPVNRWDTPTSCRTPITEVRNHTQTSKTSPSPSLCQVIKDLKGSDYSWSYQTPPSSPSSSGSRKSSMCRYSHTNPHMYTQTWRPAPCVMNCTRKRSYLWRWCFTVTVSLSVRLPLLFVQSSSV